jgi:hypothetical protein
MGRRLDRILERHHRSAEAFAESASQIPADRWQQPLGEGKWTSAQVVSHLIATYDIVLQELRGGAGMRVRAPLWLRALLRLTVVPMILFRGVFPKGARAPKETVPPESSLSRQDAIDLFRHRAAEVHEAALSAPAGRKVSHGYFGSASVSSGMLLVARHIDHHREQLRVPATRDQGLW